jgi:hypothetical protein
MTRIPVPIPTQDIIKFTPIVNTEFSKAEVEEPVPGPCNVAFAIGKLFSI